MTAVQLPHGRESLLLLLFGSWLHPGSAGDGRSWLSRAPLSHFLLVALVLAEMLCTVEGSHPEALPLGSIVGIDKGHRASALVQKELCVLATEMHLH